MSGFKGRRNIYTCHKCGAHVVTWDRDEGVTPFGIACDTVGCERSNGGYMSSSGYRVADQHIRPSREWYAPTPSELKDACLGRTLAARQGIHEHVKRGGLLSRPFPDAEPNPPAWVSPEYTQPDAMSSLKEKLKGNPPAEEIKG